MHRCSRRSTDRSRIFGAPDENGRVAQQYVVPVNTDQAVDTKPCTEAVQHIVEESASEILKMYLLDTEKSQRRWTPQQAWLLIKQLADHDSVSDLRQQPDPFLQGC